jgi:glycosyltransferase involved in cell wall biosynthesis
MESPPAQAPTGGSEGEGRRLKVLFISAAGALGGAERSLYELLIALSETPIEIHAAVPPEGPLARLCALAEVPVHPVPLRRFRRTLHPLVLAGQIKALFHGSQAISGLVKKLGIQVLHANTDSAALTAWEASRETGVPFVWHCRDLRPMPALLKPLTRSAACLVAISRSVEEWLLRQGLEASRIRRIVNGIDLLRLHGPQERAAVRWRTRQYLGLEPETPVLIEIGAWVSWKRHELFLETLCEVRRSRPDVVGLLVGSDLFNQNPGYVSFLEERADALGLDESALMVMQQRDDVPDLLAAGDALVSVSDQEPFGRVLVEAMAAGLPVAATDSGAKSEIVEDGATGFLTPPGDVRALAKACLTLIEDPLRRKDLGQAGRARALERFDVRRTARELAVLLQDCARRG